MNFLSFFFFRNRSISNKIKSLIHKHSQYLSLNHKTQLVHTTVTHELKNKYKTHMQSKRTVTLDFSHSNEIFQLNKKETICMRASICMLFTSPVNFCFSMNAAQSSGIAFQLKGESFD